MPHALAERKREEGKANVAKSRLSAHFQADGVYALAGKKNNMQRGAYLVDRSGSSDGGGGLRARAPTTKSVTGRIGIGIGIGAGWSQ